jgi:hypothetical protein
MKNKKKIIKIARKATRKFVELMEEIMASIVHLIGYVAIGVGEAVLICLFIKIIGGASVFKSDVDLFVFGIKCGVCFGAVYAVSRRFANFLTRLDIKRERKERELERQRKLKKEQESSTEDEDISDKNERWSA